MDGAWSEWSSWTQCSKTCGGGIKVRERSCTNPPPKGNGQSCVGEVEETGACSENPCPKRKFLWSFIANDLKFPEVERFFLNNEPSSCKIVVLIFVVNLMELLSSLIWDLEGIGSCHSLFKKIELLSGTVVKCI